MRRFSKEYKQSIENRLNYLAKHGKRGTRDEIEFDALNSHVQRNGYRYNRPNWWSGGGYIEEDD